MRRHGRGHRRGRRQRRLRDRDHVTADAASHIRAGNGRGRNVSACSAPLAYVEDSTDPAEPVIVSTTPPSPSGTDTTPQVSVTGEPGATLALFTTADCTGAGAIRTPCRAVGRSTSPPRSPPTRRPASARARPTPPATSATAPTRSHTRTTRPTPPRRRSPSPCPPSPGNDATPNVKGTAEAGSIVTLYKQAACAGPVAGSGTAASFAGAGLTSTAVLSGQTDDFSATATDAAGNVSPCSTTTVTYFLDDDAPTAPTISGTDPASPSNVGAPLVEGTAEPDADIEVFVGAVCTGSPAATTTADGSGDWSVATPVTPNATNSLRARQTDAAGNPPVLRVVHLRRGLHRRRTRRRSPRTLPASPSQEDQPTVSVDGTPGLVVRVYATPAPARRSAAARPTAAATP